MKLKEELFALQEEIVALRRDFHRHPELGFEEHRTSMIISDYLEACGLEVTRMAKTGIVGLLRGDRPGKTLLLRADMDALPIGEQNEELPYRSVYEGKMHACGHDGHMAMLMIAAKILSRYKDKLAGNIKFVFQPNEEDAGAYMMIEEGVMKNPSVDAVAGGHLWSGLKTGTIDISDGPVMAASHYFYLTVKGKGGHAGNVSMTVDPISISAAIIQAAQLLQTREIDILDPVAIVFTKIDAGFNTTIVPERAEMQGSIRFLANKGAEVKKAFERMVAHTCAAHRAEYELSFKVGNNIVANYLQMADLARKAAAVCLGDEASLTSGFKTMSGEDFSEFMSDLPGVFYFIGSGNREKKTDYQHHHPCFNIDEDALAIGAEMHTRFALKYFGINAD